MDDEDRSYADLEAVNDAALDHPLITSLDFRIVQIGPETSHKLELRLARRNFEFMPRDILQYISKWEQSQS